MMQLTIDKNVLSLLINLLLLSFITFPGAPIVRPLWWISPEDKDALMIDNEFLLGDELLVAPVLENKSRQRDIYLPPGGRWKDVLRQKLYDGGQWLRNYRVELFEIATFQLVKSPL